MFRREELEKRLHPNGAAAFEKASVERRAEEAQPPLPVEEIERLIEERHAARRRRDFAAADGIRKDLDARGIVLEDNAGGTRWKRK